eukprot:NODE_3616_length_934_cov_22.586121_g3464_i0.p1 GENE.NODE_3616_length_934_cov_22.586121_g3464_i0~~NODE_3616_length_934_cov_22.586121_g3464_i0.p1  ORF type:complete len:280 (-),score=118.63 NODE_3616_length_934_cov_22.586121_g3464_i0:93-887(-)
MFRPVRSLFTPVVKAEIIQKVGLLTLNRPTALNALNQQVCLELADHLKQLDRNPAVKAIVITGEGKAFAAGADIKMMAGMGFTEVMQSRLFEEMDAIKSLHTPLIAAVNGFAFGGGCELAMFCDIIIVSDKAKFGQPEIKLGTIPGMGGTQRLTRSIGKSKAMEWVLTGDQYTAEEAERAGLVSKVVPGDKLLEEAMKMATKIANMSAPVVALAKQAVNASLEVGLAEGLQFEKKCFHSTFATKDQKEGMAAFAEKRPAQFTDS